MYKYVWYTAIIYKAAPSYWVIEVQCTEQIVYCLCDIDKFSWENYLFLIVKNH